MTIDERFVRLLVKIGDRVLIIEEGDVNPDFRLPGGHIEYGEVPLDAAVRELEEEIGLVPTKMTLLLMSPKEDKPSHLVYLYLVEAFEGEFRLNLNEVHRVRFVNLRTWNDMGRYTIRQRYREYLQQAAMYLFSN